MDKLITEIRENDETKKSRASIIVDFNSLVDKYNTQTETVGELKKGQHEEIRIKEEELNKKRKDIKDLKEEASEVASVKERKQAIEIKKLQNECEEMKERVQVAENRPINKREKEYNDNIIQDLQHDVNVATQQIEDLKDQLRKKDKALSRTPEPSDYHTWEASML